MTTEIEDPITQAVRLTQLRMADGRVSSLSRSLFLPSPTVFKVGRNHRADLSPAWARLIYTLQVRFGDVQCKVDSMLYASMWYGKDNLLFR